MNYGSISSTDDRRIRIVSAFGSLLLHLLIIILLSFVVWGPNPSELIELDWGGSSGAPNQNIAQSENNPSRQRESAQPQGSTAQSKVDLPGMRSPSEAAIPVAKKASSKTSVGKKEEQSARENITSPRRRRAKDGAAGGSGKSTGYSIEWSGTGSRRLLSGRIPQYPEGTDKEMPVRLQFSVLPDGSVTGIIPLVRSDEILEREGISALRTWRFDPLPPQFEQKAQVGKITFIFKLE